MGSKPLANNSLANSDNRPRIAAVHILSKLLRQQGSLATLLPLETRNLNPQQASYTKALCFGCCRYHPRLSAVLDLLLQKPLKSRDADIHSILLLGLYQLVYMRTADHAAINESVNLASHYKKIRAKKFINGVLRSFQRNRQQIMAKAEAASVSLHPGWLEQMIQKAWGEEAEAVYLANNQLPPFTLRVNLRKNTRQDYLAQLEKKGIQASKAPFSPAGIYLQKAVTVGDLPGFAEGIVSVQDEAAQLAAGLLQLQPGQRVLDACSAPGGKTGHMAESQKDLVITALDREPRRLQKTKDTINRLSINARLICGDATRPQDWWDGQAFDRILVDAPCSATGIIRRQPDIKLLRQPGQIKSLANLQLQMLQALWPLLANGGILLYATCSILPRENTKVLQPFLAANVDAKELPITAPWGFSQPVGRQLLPGIDGHDGFYYGRLQKCH